MIIIHKTDTGKIETIIRPQEGDQYRHYAMYVTDLVRHIAKAWHVDEMQVWYYVDKERRKPTDKPVETHRTFLPRH